MTDPLTVSTESRCSETVLAVAGRLDAGTSGRLARTLGELLRRCRDRAVTIDLGDLYLIDRTGIGLLALYRAAATHLGVMLRIINPQPHIRILIETSGSDLLAAGGRPAGTLRGWPTRCAPRHHAAPLVQTSSRRRHSGPCQRAQP